LKAYWTVGRWGKKGNAGNKEENTLKLEHILLMSLINFVDLIQDPPNNSDCSLL
jgi:hypothetical protein